MRGDDCRTCVRNGRPASRGCSGAPSYRRVGGVRTAVGNRIRGGVPIGTDLYVDACPGTVMRDPDLWPLFEEWAAVHQLGVKPSLGELRSMDVRTTAAWRVFEGELGRLHAYEQADAMARSRQEAGHGHR